MIREIKHMFFFSLLLLIFVSQSAWSASTSLRTLFLESPRLHSLLRTSPKLLKNLKPGDPILLGHYGQPTEDVVFKHIMHNDMVRNDFLSTVLGQKVIESKMLDVSLNPVKEYQTLREIINQDGIAELMKEVAEAGTSFQVIKTATDYNSSKLQAFLIGLATQFEQLLRAVPPSERNTQLDVVCQTDDEVIDVEVQVEPQDFWDIRILAHACGLFQRQFPKSFEWEELSVNSNSSKKKNKVPSQIRRVVGVSILEKAPTYKKKLPTLRWYNPKPWSKTEVLRHYRLTDAKDHTVIRPGIEFYDFNLQAVSQKKSDISNQPLKLQQWLEFLAKAQYKQPQDVEGISDPALKEAFHLIEVDRWTPDMKKSYEEQQARRWQISHYVEGKVSEGKAEGIKEGLLKAAQVMKALGTMTNSDIASRLGLEEADVESIKIEEKAS